MCLHVVLNVCIWACMCMQNSHLIACVHVFVLSFDCTYVYVFFVFEFIWAFVVVCAYVLVRICICVYVL